MFREERDELASKLDSLFQDSDEEERKSDDDNCDSGWGSSDDDDADEQVRLKEGAHKNSTHNLPYYMASLEMVMSSTPQVVQKNQKVMI